MRADCTVQTSQGCDTPKARDGRCGCHASGCVRMAHWWTVISKHGENLLFAFRKLQYR